MTVNYIVIISYQVCKRGEILFFFSHFWMSEYFQLLISSTGSRGADSGYAVALETASAAGFCASLFLLCPVRNHCKHQYTVQYETWQNIVHSKPTKEMFFLLFSVNPLTVDNDGIPVVSQWRIDCFKWVFQLLDHTHCYFF